MNGSADGTVADVVVVGLGAAGAAAACAAADEGASVLALEALSGPGGSSAQSGGEIYLGGGTALQRACGVEDDVASMEAFLRAALGPHVDEEKLALYCAGSPDHYDWLCELGVRFEATVWDQPGWMPGSTAGLMWLGEAAWPYVELARPAPRGHRPPAPYFAGSVLMRALESAVVSRGVDVRTDTRVTSLITNGDRVTGVRIKRFGETGEVLARRGVVLTTGGFVDNEEMVADHAPVLLGHGKVSDGRDDGSGIAMAVALGARVRRMGAVEIALSISPALACRGIVVNGRGQRFFNEDVYPGLLSHAALHQPGPCWVVVDEEALGDLPPVEAARAVPQHAAESVEELEADLGLPAGSLVATVDLYNHHARHHRDPQWRKAGQWVRPLRGSFAAFDARVAGGATGTRTGFSGFTLGGLHTTVDGEVRHVGGGVLAGLFAAGRAAAGIHGDGYVSGTSLGDGTFYGRRAGRKAASGP